MIEDLKQAIEERVYIQFMYNGKFRYVEPYTLGKVDTVILPKTQSSQK